MNASIKKAFEQQQGFEDFSFLSGEWLIHFTTFKAAVAIAQQGFQRGSPLNAGLGHTSGKSHTTAGVNFAFPVDDDYSIMCLSGFDFGLEIDAAVIFQADAVRMMHSTDQFYQAAFWGPDAQGPFLVIWPASHEAHLEPHEWAWTDGKARALPLFDLLKRLTLAPAA
jgi:hypothetical protein